MNFETRLINKRKSLGLTQHELASACGLSPTIVSQFELGRRRPSYRNIKRLARGLSCSTDYLFGLTLNGEDMNIIHEYQSLSRRQKNEIKHIIDSLKELSPGDMIKEFMEDNSTNYTELSSKLGISILELSNIILGDEITEDLAKSLSKHVGHDKEFWLRG